MAKGTMICLAGVALAGVAAAVVAASKSADQTRHGVQRSVEYETSRDYPQAISCLQAELANHPEHYTLNLRLGWLSYLSGKQAEATRYYQAAMQAAPKSVEARLGSLLPLLADAKYQEAEASAARIVKDDAGNYYANLRLAIARRLQRKLTEADAVVQRMLTTHPADVLFLAEEAALQAAGLPNSATAAKTPAKKAERLEALRVSVEQEKSLNYREAIKTILAKYDANPNDYTFNLRLGWLNYLNGDYRRSGEYYDTAVRLAPQSVEAKLGRLLPLLAGAQYKEAESMADQVVQADPGNYYGNLRLAFALRMQGKLIAANRVVKRMLAAYPADISWLSESGLLDVAQSRKDVARETFAEVLALDPTNALAKQYAAQP
ncbi:MAG: tetratricopeptide repeat protein [Planctomycetota bacterium]|nr:tetratricopeptide repeat protein [Planctomycetota bacterium]